LNQRKSREARRLLTIISAKHISSAHRSISSDSATLGDFPIITSSLSDDREVLVKASRRYPRNQVARFIIADLDSAASLLSNGNGPGGRARITRDVALLLKARVALYEATWEKYFAGTPFVPDAAAGWPGAQKDYNSSFSYDNASEVSYFLDQALSASKEVADNHPTLTANNKQESGLSKCSWLQSLL